MSVYFLKAQGLIKVGYSANVEKRVAAVLSPFAESGELIAVIPGDRALESFFHQKLSAHHSHGEWFHPCQQIDDLLAAFGATEMATTERVRPDKADDRTLIQMYDDKYVEDCADCIQAARRHDAETPINDFYAAIAAWSGIAVRRLRDIHLGRVDTISSGEYTLCRALGETAGFKPSIVMDSIPKGRFRDITPAPADLMDGQGPL